MFFTFLVDNLPLFFQYLAHNFSESKLLKFLVFSVPWLINSSLIKILRHFPHCKIRSCLFLFFFSSFPVQVGTMKTPNYYLLSSVATRDEGTPPNFSFRPKAWSSFNQHVLRFLLSSQLHSSKLLSTTTILKPKIFS